MSAREERHRENLRRWASTELVCYTIDGWPGERGWGSSRSGLVLSGGESIVMSAGVSHRQSDGASIEVISHRQDDDQFWRLRVQAPMDIISGALPDMAPSDPGEVAALDQERTRLRQPIRDDRLAWEAAIIAVDGRPTIFCLTRIGSYWAAVGRGPDVDLTIASRGVAFPRALVRYDQSAPPLRHRSRSPSQRRPHNRRFPDESLGPVLPADIADQTRVDLTYRDGHELTGTWAGRQVELYLVVPAHDATATGTFTGSDVTATWHLGDNSAGHPDVPGSLNGTFAGQPFALNAVFHLDDDYFTDHATIAGAFAGETIAGRLEAADGGIGGSAGGTMYVEGSFADSNVSLFATIAGGYKAVVRGQVANKLIELDAKAGDRSVRVAGTYEGPSALLAVIVVTLLHFLVAP